jgi:hypothetical protein
MNQRQQMAADWATSRKQPATDWWLSLQPPSDSGSPLADFSTVKMEAIFSVSSPSGLISADMSSGKMVSLGDSFNFLYTFTLQIYTIKVLRLLFCFIS